MSDAAGTSVDGSFTVTQSSKAADDAQEQEINDLLEFLKLERQKYTKYKILVETVEECIGEDENSLNHELNTKIEEILSNNKLAQTLKLDDTACDEAGSLLGITDLESLELNYAESSQLQRVLKQKLKDKHSRYSEEFLSVTNKNLSKTLDSSNDAPNNLELSTQDKKIIEQKIKLKTVQEEYVGNLLQMQNLLKDIANLRLRKLPEAVGKEVRKSEITSEINLLKSQMSLHKVNCDIFMETSSSLQAYRKLIVDIKEQQRECKREIEDLKELKEKYKQVQCKQYEEILVSYIAYKASLERKKLMYDCLRNK